MKIIIMKYGVHADEKVDSIIKRKQKEIEENGYCFWGYGGTLLHPTNQVQPFCRDDEVYLLLTKTESQYKDNKVKSTEFSIDKKTYDKIPPSISVYGSKYALVFKDLKRYDGDIDLDEYKVGIGPSKDKRLSEYFKYRVDKACAIKTGSGSSKNLIHIDYIAKMEYPYSIFVK